MVHFLDPKLVAGVIVEMDRKLVMIKRDLEPGMGLWTFPAGFVDRGEVVEEAAKREVREETGLEVEIRELVGVYSRDGDANILVVYAGKAAGGQLQAGEEVQEAGLFDPGLLPPLAFERDDAIIQRWLEGKTQRLT
ncbi:MAG: NUDIX domain-containing protein [Chloroflexi bacterium]|nr:NUDIX domain-containing protein [Chloroflexota bacterium]